MQEHNKLVAEYRDICPHVQKIYVIPDIEKFSVHNIYLKLFYHDFLENKVSFIQLNSFSFLNPVIIYRKLLGENSILHHHWWEFDDFRSLLNVLWKLVWISVYKLLGGKIIWSIHNLEPHHNRYVKLNKFLRKVWSRLPHKLHVQCQEAVNIMSAYLNIDSGKFFIIEHPPYPAKMIPHQEARKRLSEQYLPGLKTSNNLIFLMFGYIAEYKGIIEVAELFKNLNERKVLLIAGPVKRDSEAYFRRLADITKQIPNILLIGRHIADDDIPIFMNGCDYLIFNYKRILNSGGVVLAQSYHTKMIIPHKGCLKELSGEQFLKFDDQTELKRILENLS